MIHFQDYCLNVLNHNYSDLYVPLDNNVISFLSFKTITCKYNLIKYLKKDSIACSFQSILAKLLKLSYVDIVTAVTLISGLIKFELIRYRLST